MAYGIERRLKWDLFNFVFVDRDHYEDLGRYVPARSDYRPLIEPHLSDDWRLVRESIWYHAAPPASEVPEQGFKIHVSATSQTAPDMLRRVVPLCRDAGVPFKAIVDASMLDFTNCKSYSRVSSGKFLTLYPANEQDCGCLLESLHEATRGLEGPYVLSDRPYKDSKVIFYRYGGFRPRFRLNLFGERVPLIQQEGKLVPDLRLPYFRLPPGVSDPFSAPPPAPPNPVVLKDRYVIERSIRFSNSGGIYLALDRETDQTVVLKEARPFVNFTAANAVDAVATLRKEAQVLQALQHTSYVPRFVDLFQEWEHSFLVEEYIVGTPLSSYRAIEDIGLLVQRDITSEGVAAFCQKFGRLARHLLKTVRAFHEQGILIGDLSPSNILVQREDLEIKIIDFEGAIFLNGEHASLDSTVTTGFTSKERLSGEAPSEADDYYALGSVLYSIILPVQEFFPLSPAAQPAFLGAISRDYGLPQEVSDLIFALLNGFPEQAETALESLAAPVTRPWRPEIEAEPRLARAEVLDTLRGIRHHLLALADCGREDRLWPADCRLFLTNPLSLAYGALGNCLFLQRTSTQDGIPQEIRHWILEHPLDGDRYPPGLFVGLAGVAWSLCELGFPQRAEEAMERANASPLLHEGPDIFFGDAGWGLSNLYLWTRFQRPELLDRACEAAQALTAAARWDSTGCYWVNADGIHYYGFAHGGSGIAFFLLKLYQATREHRWLEWGTAALDYEASRAIKQGASVTWERSVADPLISPYWRHGAAGVGSVLIRYAEALGSSYYRELAEKAARYVAAKYAVFPGQFVGLSGMGEFLLDMYHLTSDPAYLQDAWRIAEGLLLFRTERPQGVVFPGEELIRLSTDFGTGSAGVGLFLARLLQPGGRLFYDFELTDRWRSPE